MRIVCVVGASATVFYLSLFSSFKTVLTTPIISNAAAKRYTIVIDTLFIFSFLDIVVLYSIS
jgi:hypothetical protein